MAIDPRPERYTATIETSAGTMVHGDCSQATPPRPSTTSFLAREGFYDGVIFHRTHDRWLHDRGRRPPGPGRGGPGYRFDDEPVKRPYSAAPRPPASAGPNTNGKFFVMHADYRLPNYTIFASSPPARRSSVSSRPRRRAPGTAPTTRSPSPR
ncbi:MAG: peptidylprolyl isomerase [Chloroflexota bacterium]